MLKMVLLTSGLYGFWWEIHIHLNSSSISDFGLHIFFPLSCFQQLDYNVTRYGFHWAYPILRFAEPLESIGLCLSPNLGSFQWLFKYFFLHSILSSFLLGVWWNKMSDFLVLSHRSLKLCSLFYSTFFLSVVQFG